MRALLKNPLFDCDLEEAALWYNRRDPDVAERLIKATQEAMRLAATDPFRFPVCFREYRRIRIHGFRYALYFKVQGDTVRILALVHGARDVELILHGRSSLEE